MPEQKKELEIMKSVPSQRTLVNLLAAGCIEDTQELIDKWKLPYRIEGTELKSSYSQGELYLQKFITVDKDMLLMKQEATKIAASKHEVLVMGATGTGKEIISKSMIGDRKGQIKAVNCAGFPKDLIESELFGHVAGAFTSAGRTKEGLISSAQDGVMFMDEVGELPLELQSKLLRALQDKTIRKVGSNVEETINCKFVFATNRDLRAMVKQGNFREDLYARISPLKITISPLKERMCDVVPICESIEGGKKFLERYKEDLESGILDLSLNVRSLQAYIIQFDVLGRLIIEKD